MSQSRLGKLVIVAGPSGVGKTTVVERVLRDPPVPLVRSISATTRPPRAGERDGVDYHFLGPEEFQRRREAGEFLECCEVFGQGYWYGTLRQEVTSGLAAGKWVLLEIDVQGTLAVLEQYPDAVTIFVRPPSLEELERRLRSRGSETEQAIARRLEVARQELAYRDRFRHDVINHSVDEAAGQIHEILEKSGE